MIETKQVILFMKKYILFPFNQLIIEVTNDLDKQAIDKALEKKSREILLVYLEDMQYNVQTLPKIAIVAEIKDCLFLENNNYRVVLNGLRRVKIRDYINDGKLLLASRENILVNFYDEALKLALVNKVKEKLVALINYKIVGNSIYNIIENSNSLDKISDVIASFLPLNKSQKLAYLYELDSKKRMENLLLDISTLISSYQIEFEIENKLTSKILSVQKESIIAEKIKLLKEELGELSTKEEEINNLRRTTLMMLAPKEIKDKIYNEIKKYEALPSMSPELSLTKGYIDTLLSLPFFSEENPININRSYQILNNNHYGLDLIKERIMEFVITSAKLKKGKKPIICLVGPPGVGKTTLAKSIAAASNREFVKISLGGVNDEADIIGHRKTYVGSYPGRIIQGMIKAKTNNPVFLIDEIDKMLSSFKGDPASCLLEVLDYEQNKTFKDNYLEIEYDLSQVFFITTANDLSSIAPALLDRMEIIEVASYTPREKEEIFKKHIMPKYLKEYQLNAKQIIITNDMIHHLINCYTKEAGVRELERVTSQILRKLKVRLIKSGKSRQFYLNLELITELLGPVLFNYNKIKENQIGVVNALVWTSFGGDILPLEVVKYNGREEVIITGCLGNVMKESITCSLSYIRSNATTFGIDKCLFENQTIHLHFPEASIKKEGPSAGIAITTALISLFKNIQVEKTIALTGEITITGDILPIGGLKEKSLGALRSGVKTIYIPKDNEKDLPEIKKLIKDEISFIPITNYIEIYEKIFAEELISIGV